MTVPVTMKFDRIPTACFAPEIDEATLAKYKSLADALPDSLGELRDVMRECLACFQAWWNVPESDHKPQEWDILHKGSKTTFKLTPFTEDLKKQLDDSIPWPYEIKAMANLLNLVFDGADEHGVKVAEPTCTCVETRNAAFHLLWYATEFCNDREPLTKSVLPS